MPQSEDRVNSSEEPTPIAAPADADAAPTVELTAETAPESDFDFGETSVTHEAPDSETAGSDAANAEATEADTVPDATADPTDVPAEEQPTVAAPSVLGASHVAPKSVDGRPQPQFGEYAPEGWDWKPPAEATAASESAPAVPVGTGSSSSGGPVPKSLPGVPHNLGAGSALPGRGGATPAQDRKQAATVQPHSARQNSAPSQARAARTQTKPRSGDKIISILLLAAGAVGSLQFALAMMNIDKQFALMANAPGVDGFAAPAWLDTTGNVLGLAVLAIYGITLVYTIRRLRSGKLTFWVPLTAGAIVFVVIIGTVFFAMVSSPGFADLITDPEQSAKLLEYLQGMSQPK